MADSTRGTGFTVNMGGMPNLRGAGSRLLRIVLVIVILLLLMWSATSIPTGNVGVLTLFGRVTGEVLPAGIHVINPLKSAFQLAGYESVGFELEPVAAAHYYESTLDHDELILIGDFGGGTSDFSLVRVGPSIRKRGRSPADLLGNAGLGLAGDAFDAKIIKHLVSPALGAGSSIRSMHKILPFQAGCMQSWNAGTICRCSGPRMLWTC